MIGPAPEYSWDKYIRKVGEIKPADPRRRERGDVGFAILALSKDAPDEVKMEFEKFQKMSFGNLARFFVPEMKEPYYTWEGKIVERHTLEGRELPLS